MKFLLFNWKLLPDEHRLNDPSELIDEEFKALSDKYGTIIHSAEDFEAQFNAEHFSTATHQLRIIL